jgi:hypothetical protein
MDRSKGQASGYAVAARLEPTVMMTTRRWTAGCRTGMVGAFGT